MNPTEFANKAIIATTRYIIETNGTIRARSAIPHVTAAFAQSPIRSTPVIWLTTTPL